MSAPTNISAASATDLGTLPASVSQNVHDAGTTYTVWYRYTAAADDAVVGFFGFGDLTAYFVRTQVFNNVAALPANEIIDTGTGSNANKAVQFAVTPAVTYYIKLSPPAGNPSPAVLLIEAQSFAQQTAPSGSIAVNDDTEGFPLTIIDATNGDILRFVNPFPSGEAGDVLNDGTSLVYNLDSTTLSIYDDQFNVVTTITGIDLSSFFGVIRTCQGTQRFWMAYVETGVINVRSVTSTGTLGTAHTLTAIATVACIAANNDETILYYTPSSSSKIARWNLSTDTAMADLVATSAGYITSDMLLMSDDTILVIQSKTSAMVDVRVRRYDAAGTLLNTYSFGSANAFPGGTLPRLAYSPTDPTDFWIWRHPSGGDLGTSRFENVTVSSGAIITTVDTVQFETGVYNPSATASPTNRFGNSFSCPFWIIRSEFPTGGGGTGTIRVVKVTIPSSDTTEFDFTAGGGLTPTTFSLQGGDEQVYNSVTAGDGYSVEETPNPLYVTTVDVSNDSPNTNISVAEDETVVVTFTNSAMGTMNFDVVPIKRRWLRRSPIYTKEQKRVRWNKFTLSFQAGMGNTVDPGVDPIVYLRVSGDWGQTWSSTRQISAGKKGQYNHQVTWWNLGVHRQLVVECYGSDPCPVYITDAYAEVEPGLD